MPVFNPKRFAHPDCLRSIDSHRLCEFLTPFENYLSNQGFAFSGNDSPIINYTNLSEVLMSPDESIPKEMVDALFYVHEMASMNGMEKLLEAVEKTGIQLDYDTNTSPADIAVQVWLKNPELLELVYAKSQASRPRSFRYFYGRHAGRDLQSFSMPSSDQIHDLEHELDDWFEAHRRGRNCKIFIVDQDEKVHIIIRHGMPFKREGSIKNGKSSSVAFRPEKHDVLIYNRASDEIAIHTSTKGELQLYLTLIGKYMFGSAEHFPSEDKYTLSPLLSAGKASMVCSDVDGMEWAVLRELSSYSGEGSDVIETRKAKDLFSSISNLKTVTPLSKLICRAVFSIKLAQVKRPRAVTICPPNIALITRDEESSLIENWLSRRGFIRIPQEA
ncbi:hypothetical protein ACQZV8_07475 [Magnetococcales bacterium HHB-1]